MTEAFNEFRIAAWEAALGGERIALHDKRMMPTRMAGYSIAAALAYAKEYAQQTGDPSRVHAVSRIKTKYTSQLSKKKRTDTARQEKARELSPHDIRKIIDSRRVDTYALAQRTVPGSWLYRHGDA